MEENQLVYSKNGHTVLLEQPSKRNISVLGGRRTGGRGLSKRAMPQGIEKRQAERFKLQKEVFAIVRPQQNVMRHQQEMTMGQIAASVYNAHPAKLGRLKNISKKGLCMSYLGYPEEKAVPLKMDILVITDHFFVDDLCFDMAYDIEPRKSSCFDNFKIKQLGIRLKHLTPLQSRQLDFLIQTYAVP